MKGQRTSTSVWPLFASASTFQVPKLTKVDASIAEDPQFPYITVARKKS
jgi:hypothetical protein